VDWGNNNYKKIISYSFPKNVLKQNSASKLATVFLLGATLMLLTSPLATNEAFATHLSLDLKWQLVYISSAPACSNYHLQMANKYQDVTFQYLDLYKVQNQNYDPLCMPLDDYLSDYETPHDLDLIVLVYDRNLGEKELHSNNMGGLYSHTGIDRSQNHVIIICDCSNFYYSNPVWILSHELSHFILYFKDYEMSVIEDFIHVNDKKFDQCQEVYTEDCSTIKTRLHSNVGHDYTVMPAYQPAINAKNTNKNTNQAVSSTILVDLSKMITKWWSDGKITDGDYANAVGFVIDNNVLSSHENPEILMGDDPLDDSITWEQMMEEITPQYWDRPAKIDEEKNVLSYIPDNFISGNGEGFSEDTVLGLPGWFKNTAAWWARGEITDKEFKKNVEFLVKNGIVPDKASQFIEILSENKATVDTEQPTITTEQPTITTEQPTITTEQPTITTEQPTITTEQPTVDTESILENAKQVNQKVKEMQKNLAEDDQTSVDLEAFQGLNDEINSLVTSGDLDSAFAEDLIGLVNTSKEQFESEKTSDGCGALDQFKNQIYMFIQLKQIPISSGESLINYSGTLKVTYC